MDRYKRDEASQQRAVKPSYHNLDMYMMKQQPSAHSKNSNPYR